MRGYLQIPSADYAYAHHAMVLGYTDEEVNRFFAKALFAIGEDWGMDELLPIVMEVGEKNLKCMEPAVLFRRVPGQSFPVSFFR